MQQHVMLEAKLLMQRTAFVGHSFSESDVEVVDFFKSLLAELCVRCLSGEEAQAKSVSEKVKQRIKEAELFVGILTRRDKMEGKDEWSTSPWVVEEKAHAQAIGKKLILLKEVGVSQIGGLQGDYEYVEFDRSCLHKAAIRLIQTIWSLNPGKLSLGQSGAPSISPEILEAAIAAQPEEPLPRVFLAQHRIRSGRVEAGMRELQSVLTTHPDFQPARIEVARALNLLGKKDEALAELEQILAANPFAADAHHSKAHILEARGDATGARQALEAAINCNPGQATHHHCLGVLLFRQAGDDRSRLQEAKEQFELAVSIGGQRQSQLCHGYFQEIKNKLKNPIPKAKAKKRRKRKRR
ncbi:MAG: tetratricopeptide repeat protein [Sedimentisphaerales bacterium]|nr:tetratricopeptide repeat protein [Sedimentisphaerales bacterium]